MDRETGYALLGEARIAYRVVGRGPPDLVVSAGTFGNVDWEDPMAARMYRRDASFSRLIRFDRRGSGVPSPKFAGLPRADGAIAWPAVVRLRDLGRIRDRRRLSPATR
jgi:pimeloyl-ACP methyl ester carboxylesterase